MAANLDIVLYALIAAFMLLVILSFVIFIVALKCRRKDDIEYADWIRTGSIEHLRFNNPVVGRGGAQRFTTSTPCSDETRTFEEFIASQYANFPGIAYSEYLNPLQNFENTLNVSEIHEKPRCLFQTFRNVKEPKYIYWETRV